MAVDNNGGCLDDEDDSTFSNNGRLLVDTAIGDDVDDS